MKYSFAALALATIAAAKPKFTNTSFNPEEGKPFELTFSDCDSKCTIILQSNGGPNKLKDIQTLTSKFLLRVLRDSFPHLDILTLASQPLPLVTLPPSPSRTSPLASTTSRSSTTTTPTTLTSGTTPFPSLSRAPALPPLLVTRALPALPP